MRINFIIPSYGESGGLKIVYKYASEFLKRGHDVKLIYPLFPYNLYRDDGNFFFIKQIIGFLLRIWHALRKDRYNPLCKSLYMPVFTIANATVRDADIVIATAWPTAYSVHKLVESKGEKYYFIQDFEVWDNYEKGLQSYYLPLNKITISNWIVSKLRTAGIEENIPIVRNGIDDNLFISPKRNFEDKITCCMLFHELEKKGVKNGIAAFEMAKEKNLDIDLVLFGLRQPKNYKLPYRFVENPSRQELAELYKNTEIFIFPSLEEGWGLTVVEAMATGCAVVGTNTGCILEIGRNEENLLVSEPGDVEAMANNIERLCRNKKLLQRISEQAAKVTQELSWDRSIDLFLKILSEKGVES